MTASRWPYLTTVGGLLKMIRNAYLSCFAGPVRKIKLAKKSVLRTSEQCFVAWAVTSVLPLCSTTAQLSR